MCTYQLQNKSIRKNNIFILLHSSVVVIFSASLFVLLSIQPQSSLTTLIDRFLNLPILTMFSFALICAVPFNSHNLFDVLSRSHVKPSGFLISTTCLQMRTEQPFATHKLSSHCRISSINTQLQETVPSFLRKLILFLKKRFLLYLFIASFFSSMCCSGNHPCSRRSRYY